MSADRYASATRRSPQSWNRHSYVQGDPTGLGDPSGQVACSLDGADVPCELIGSEDLVGDGGVPLDPAQVLLLARSATGLPIGARWSAEPDQSATSRLPERLSDVPSELRRTELYLRKYAGEPGGRPGELDPCLGRIRKRLGDRIPVCGKQQQLFWLDG